MHYIRSMAKPKPLVLIVEDDRQIAQLVADHLEMSGMMTQVFNRAAGVQKFLTTHFANLMLLDVNLPDKNGLDLVHELRNNNLQVPVIFLTGDDREVQKVKGFQVGGDDYVTKPFSFPELKARIHAVLRRSETAFDFHITRNASLIQSPFEFCGVTVNPNRMQVTFQNGETMKIGRKELGIMTHMVNNPNTVITRRSLIHSVWGIHADIRSRSLDQYIVKIRHAFKKQGVNLDAFRTIHGVGYIYNTRGGDSKPFPEA